MSSRARGAVDATLTKTIDGRAGDARHPSADAAAVSPYKGKTGWTRLRNALFYSMDGFAAAFRNEDAFRQEALLALILIPIALYAPVTASGKAIMIGSVLLVLIVELLNSGIEAVTDRVSLEDHVLAKQAKDMGSAAVLLSLVCVPVVWLTVFFG
ncbi:MAG: diacylglycerol kinase [Rhodospirillaceae bacterium]